MNNNDYVVVSKSKLIKILQAVENSVHTATYIQVYKMLNDIVDDINSSHSLFEIKERNIDNKE